MQCNPPALGPLIGGPLSEAYGRKAVYLYSCPIFILATIGSALSPSSSPAALSILRFISGAAGAPCFAVSAGTAADIWDMEHGGGLAVVAITQAGFLGPTIGPLVGGYIMRNRNDWRWTMWVLAMTISPVFLAVIFSKETSRKQILETRNRRNQLTAAAAGEKKHEGTLSWQKAHALVTVVLFRPLRMLFTEPIVASITVYNAFVFGELFAFFASYPYVFTKVYGFSSAQVGLAFIGVLVGTVLGVLTFMVVDKTLYAKAKQRALDGKPPPEERLYTSMFGSFGISISLFWFGWTARSDVHWMVPIAAGLPFGWGMVCVFVSLPTYLLPSKKTRVGCDQLTETKKKVWVNDISRRHIPLILWRVSPCCKHATAVRRGSRLPPIHHPDVFPTGDPLGQ